jgi:hypothetical protein
MIDIAINVVLLTGAIIWALIFVAVVVFIFTIIFGAKQ